MRTLNFKNNVCNRWMRNLDTNEIVNFQFILSTSHSQSDVIIKNTITGDTRVICTIKGDQPEDIKYLIETSTKYYIDNNHMKVNLGIVPKSNNYRSPWWVHKGVLKRLIRIQNTDGSFVIYLIHHSKVVETFYATDYKQALSIIKKQYCLGVSKDQV